MIKAYKRRVGTRLLLTGDFTFRRLVGERYCNFGSWQTTPANRDEFLTRTRRL